MNETIKSIYENACAKRFSEGEMWAYKSLQNVICNYCDCSANEVEEEIENLTVYEAYELLRLIVRYAASKHEQIEEIIESEEE